MYHSSTQRKFWTFKEIGEINRARAEVNSNYRKKYIEKYPGKDPRDDTFFLTVAEESQLLRWFDEKLLKDFCRGFNPPIPPNTIGTACQYVKRLFLRCSVMDYNPKLMILACIWLACKTEEYNVSMDQFVWNIHHLLKGEAVGPNYAEKYGEAILAVELILIKELNFHLIIHNPFRAFEGFLIDVKTRYQNPSLENPEILRKQAKDFLYASIFTDAVLLFAPSQVALASILSTASKQNIIMDTYVTEHLLADQPQKVLEETMKNVKKIRSLIRKNPRPPSAEVASALEQKWERCRDKHTDPFTSEYQQQRTAEEEERDRVSTQRWRAEAERQQRFEADLLGF